MDNQDKPMFCMNLPCQGSANLDLGSTVPFKQPENYIVPNFISLKSPLQEDFLFETFIPNSVKYPSYPNSQMFHIESVAKPNSVGVTVAAVTPSVQECKLGGAKEASCYFHAFETSSAPCSKVKSSVIGNQNLVAKVEGSGVCNGLPSEGLRLEPSKACQKRFMMFDQTGNTGRILFYPNQFSDLPNSAKLLKEGMNLEAPSAGNYIDWGKTVCPAYRETLVASAYAALQKMREDRLNSTFLDIFGNDFIADSVDGEESTSRVSYHGLMQARTSKCESELHEDTEDLEALLSSDDEESSTGRSPSEITENNGDIYVEDDIADVTSGISVKRRRYEELEVDSVPASVKEPFDKILTDEKCIFPDLSVVDTSSWEPPVQSEYTQDIKGDNYNDILLCSRSSYSITDECSSKSSGNEQIQSFKCHSRQSRSSKKSRKKKIQKSVRLLRSIIPGGNDMGTGIVLDEAIQYVKLLQVKLKKLEANQ